MDAAGWSASQRLRVWWNRSTLPQVWGWNGRDPGRVEHRVVRRRRPGCVGTLGRCRTAAWRASPTLRPASATQSRARSPVQVTIAVLATSRRLWSSMTLQDLDGRRGRPGSRWCRRVATVRWPDPHRTACRWRWGLWPVRASMNPRAPRIRQIVRFRRTTRPGRPTRTRSMPARRPAPGRRAVRAWPRSRPRPAPVACSPPAAVPATSARAQPDPRGRNGAAGLKRTRC